MHLKSDLSHLMSTSSSMNGYHNNNQPFNHVQLAVSEVQVSDEEEDVVNGNGTVTVYSLYDDPEGGHLENGGVDAQLPRPSENLRFVTNEYGFLELLDSDSDSSGDSDSDSDSGDDRPDNPVSVPITEDESEESTVSCIVCGCFALLTEFYDAKHCTYDCSVITRINDLKMKSALEEEEKAKEEQETGQGVKREIDEEDEELDCKRIKLEVIEEEEEIEEDSGVMDNPFRINDVLEAIDPQHQSLFCPVTVVEVLGFRLLLKFIGYSDKYNFWANADSKYIFPVNWSNTYTHSQLHFHGPPNFTWEAYLESNESCRVAPDSSFPHINAILEHKSAHVRVGMKVEAVDRRNKNLICVATVSCVLGDRFLIHFDSWDSLYDYWTFIGSGDVFYCGYCKDHGIDITPPHCYENASEFEWEEYLKKTNSVAMPRDLMNVTAQIPFQVGQQVEVIDKRSPRLLRLALIKHLDPNTSTVTVHFPSLKSPSFDYDMHAHSELIHELGWGSSTGHPLADDDFDESAENDSSQSRSPSPEHSSFPMCPNHKLCKSVCNVRGPNFPFHSKLRDCPYSVPNMQAFSESGKFTDRVVVFEDAHYDLGGSNSQVLTEIKQEVEQPEDEESSNDKEQITTEIEKVVVKLETKVVARPQTQALLSRNSNPINFNNFNGVRSTVSPQKQSTEIPKRSEILTWSHDRISNLVQSLCSNLPTAQKVADQFRNNLIDGESFLMLTQSDMTDALGIKLGPAVKIYNLIRLIDLNK